MRRSRWFLGGLVVVSMLVVACGPAAPASPPAAPAAPVAQPAKPAVPAAQPAQPAKPAAQAPQPAKPAAPAAQPAKPAAQSKELRRVIHGTTALSSIYGVYSAALVKMLNQTVPGVNVTLAEYGSGQNNLKRVLAGEAGFGTADGLYAYLAYSGQLKGWETTPAKEARLLWHYDTNAQPYVVNDRSGIKEFADLTGKAFSPGGQGTVSEAITEMTFEFLGVKPQYYRGSINEMIDAFKNRRIIGFVKGSPVAASDPSILDAMTSQPIRVLNWPSDVVQKLKAKYPFLMAIQIPAGVYKADWNQDPITTWGAWVAIFGSTQLADDVAYGVVKAVLQDKTEQVAAYPAMKGIDVGKLTVESGALPLHKGAIKALREAGHAVPARLVPPEAQ